MQRSLLAAAALSASVLLAACGANAAADGNADEPVAAPAAGMCAPDMPDCVDTVVDGDGSDASDVDVARETAEGLLGLPEGDLAPDIRVSRRGDEHLMLTEDYQIGRMTVELDADADGVFRVTKVVLELEGGPETFSA